MAIDKTSINVFNKNHKTTKPTTENRVITWSNSLASFTLLHHHTKIITHTADALLSATKYHMGERRNTPTAQQWIAKRQRELNQDMHYGMSVAETGIAHRAH